jgi:hypothetical protein
VPVDEEPAADVPVAAAPDARADTKVCISESSFASILVPVVEAVDPDVAFAEDVLPDVAAAVDAVVPVALSAGAVDEALACNWAMNV